MYLENEQLLFLIILLFKSRNWKSKTRNVISNSLKLNIAMSKWSAAGKKCIKNTYGETELFYLVSNMYVCLQTFSINWERSPVIRLSEQFLPVLILYLPCDNIIGKSLPIFTDSVSRNLNADLAISSMWTANVYCRQWTLVS